MFIFFIAVIWLIFGIGTTASFVNTTEWNHNIDIIPVFRVLIFLTWPLFFIVMIIQVLIKLFFD